MKSGTLARLLRDHVRPHVPRMILAAVAMIVAAVATASNAWLMQPVLDRVLLQRDQTLLWLIPLAIVIAALVIIGLVIALVRMRSKSSEDSKE